MSHILYVDKNKTNLNEYCPGSIVCMHLSRLFPENSITIQDCSILRNADETFPDWLKGTPTILNTEYSDVYTGMEAIDYLGRSIPDKKMDVDAMERDEPSPPLLEEVQASEDLFVSQPATDALERDGKVTEQDLQTFMAERNKGSASKGGRE